MLQTVAIISAFLHLAVAVFQLALVAGKPWGHLAWGGKYPGVLPGSMRLGSAVAFFALCLFAAVNLQTAALFPAVYPTQIHKVMQWIVTVYAGLGTLMNAISPSRHERLLWTPVAALLFAANLLIVMKS